MFKNILSKSNNKKHLIFIKNNILNLYKLSKITIELFELIFVEY